MFIPSLYHHLRLSLTAFWSLCLEIFISFPRVLVLCEMQSVSARIWTRVAVSISYDDNPYTTNTSMGITWISLATSLYHPSLPAALPGYIRISTELLIGSNLSFSPCSSVWRGQPEYIANEFVLISPAVSQFGWFSWWMAVELRFVESCLQNLFNTAHRILVYLPSSFFFIHLFSVHVVHPYYSTDTTAAWKNLRFILSDRSDFRMTDSLSIAVHDFASHVLMSFSVDEILLPRFGVMNRTTI